MSTIYVVNNASVTVPAGSGIPVGGIVREKCESCGCYRVSGTTINVTKKGWYLVSVSATFTAPATGDVTISMLQNGVEVSGATATESITVADTQPRNISFTSVIRVNCCSPSTLSFEVSGSGATITNFATAIVKTE